MTHNPENNSPTPHHIRTTLENGTKLEHPEDMVALKSEDMVCIDGRSVQKGAFAGPGGALGFMIAILDGLEKSELIPTSGTYAYYINKIEEKIGSITWHTDTHHDESDLPCAGCGHCSGIINNPAFYDVSKELVCSVRAHLITQDEKNKTVLEGEHEERAVIILQGNPPAMTLPGTTPGGQTFVYHKDVWEDNLEDVTIEILGDIQSEDALENAIRMVKKSATEQLRITVKALGANKLPTYVVNNLGEIV